MVAMDPKPLIRFRCECGKKLKADASLIGRKVKCSHCDKINTVPSESTELARRERKANMRLSHDKPAAESPATKSPASTEKAAAADEKFKGSPGPEKISRPPARKPNNPIEAPAPSLMGDDSEVDNDTSLLPFTSEAENRFKQAPELDPEPSEELIGASDSFDFDPELIDYASTSTGAAASPEVPSTPSKARSQTTTKATKPASTNDDKSIEINTDFEPRFKLKKESRIKPIHLYIGGGVGVFVALAGLIYLAIVMSAGAAGQFPESFEKLSEVKRYRKASVNYEKARRQYRIMSESYEKTKEISEEELTEIKDYLASTQRDHQEVLQHAYDRIQGNQGNEAKADLRSSSQALLQKLAEINSKASDIQKKL